MSGKIVPRNYSCMTSEERERFRLKSAFSAQKGWQYDEFGDFLQEVVSSKGYNNLFYRLLKQLYDNKPETTYDTGTRGEEDIYMPSLSIIGTTAPESLNGIPEKVWTDGAFARISFIVPPVDSLKLQSAPDGEADVPSYILQKLIQWHNRLGIPECEIIDLWEQEELMNEAHGKDNKKKQTGDQYKIVRGDLPQNKILWSGSGIREAHEAYFQALMIISRDCDLDPRLASNYVRLPDMALKIAMLLASLENNNIMEMKHWARGQSIAEHWRTDLHELLAQLSHGDNAGGYGEIEDQIIDIFTRLKKGETIHPRAISQKSRALRKLGAPEIRRVCEDLVMSEPERFLRDGKGREATYGLCP
jgi:hypothetical protein